MLYYSTRGEGEKITAAEAIKRGIAPDGGLYTPAKKIRFNNYEHMLGLSYQQLAAAILEPFLGEFDEKEIEAWAQRAYSKEKFDTPRVAPLKKLSGDLYILELWHGPTCAFKDMALQLLPYLLKGALEKTGEQSEVAILVATSGDTGKAALEAFRDVAGTKIVVFFPEEGVSRIQKQQMVTQEGSNVYVIAVRGNFDDAQSGVKAIFTDDKIRKILLSKGYRLSSANSINWGRLLPQIVYYFWAYLELVRKREINHGEKINFTVPTGNFGNILAGYYARQAGLPLNKLICASNINNVLTDFINTGVYNHNRPFYRTISPSMDILISSNLERLLFEVTGHRGDKVKKWMEELKAKGEYKVDPATAKTVANIFSSYYADDEEAIATIRKVYDEFGYLMDPHTAVGMAVYDKYRQATKDPIKNVILSTASPFKFNQSVASSLLEPFLIADKDEFQLLEMLADYTGWAIPPGLKDLEKKPVLHGTTVNKDEMAEIVLKILS